MNELDTKLERVYALLERHSLGGLVLRRVSSFAWATCGAASYVNTAATDGAAALLITPNKRMIITNNIEAERIEREEKLGKQGWKIAAMPWYGSPPSYTSYAGGLPLGADGPVPGCTALTDEVARLRAQLTPEEGARFRELGKSCAEAMRAAAIAVRPGMSEYQIAALLADQAQQRGIQPIVNLIATDERIFQFRHPLPTSKIMQRYAMLVLSGRRNGLVCSITRLVHFGGLPDELKRKNQAVAQIDIAMIAATRPGKTLGQIFEETRRAYARNGFGEEWKLHHQGGAVGYEPREYLALPDSPDEVSIGQAYAWNPSSAGVKSEDTILVGDEQNEILTEIDGWPVVEFEQASGMLRRPAILEAD